MNPRVNDTAHFSVETRLAYPFWSLFDSTTPSQSYCAISSRTTVLIATAGEPHFRLPGNERRNFVFNRCAIVSVPRFCVLRSLFCFLCPISPTEIFFLGKQKGDASAGLASQFSPYLSVATTTGAWNSARFVWSFSVGTVIRLCTWPTTMRSVILLVAILALLCACAPAASAAKVPSGPIKHFIVLMMENRAFDHMLGWMSEKNPNIKGLNGTQSNPWDYSKPNGRRIFASKDAMDVRFAFHSYFATRDSLQSNSKRFSAWNEH